MRFLGRARTGAVGVLVVGVVALAGCTATPPGGPGGATTDGTSPPASAPEPSPSGDAPTALAALLVSAREPGIPVPASDGTVVVAYELGLHNASPLTLTVAGVEIATPAGDVVATLDADDVEAALALPSRRSAVTELTEAQTATLYLAPRFAEVGDVPDRLLHRVRVTAPDLGADGQTTAPLAVPVDAEAPVPVLGPPLEAGTGYIAADSCCTSERHRRALLPVENGLWLAQRFAIDWEQLDDAGRTVTGEDPTDPADYTIFGRRALAVADATVVHVVDGLPEQVPGALPAEMTLAEADGNSVVLDLGDGRYALYAHLQAGSIPVAVGDRVARGDVLGLVGNTGNSSAPHLHFHVMDGPSPLTSEGVPYVIEAFAVDGEITSTEAFDELENTTTPLPVRASASDGSHRRTFPLDRVLVTFE